MARDPEFFRGMNAMQIWATLVVDEREAQHTKARAVGARCVDCLDTGMKGGIFCSCAAGATVGMQSNKKL